MNQPIGVLRNFSVELGNGIYEIWSKCDGYVKIHLELVRRILKYITLPRKVSEKEKTGRMSQYYNPFT